MVKISKGATKTGLDIGSSYIKFAQLSGGIDNPLLLKCDVIKVEGKAEASKKALASIAHKIAPKDVNIAVSGPDVIIRHITLPKMTNQELKSSMRFEAEKYIPFSLKDVIMDCQVVETTSQGKMKVLLAAAKKDAVMERIKLVEGVGLSVNLIDCDSFALVNAFLLNFQNINEDSSLAFVSIGERSTTINVLKGKNIFFTRELQIGGRNFSKIIAEKLNMDSQAAADLKEKPSERLQEVTDVVKPVIAQIVDETKLSLNYYENQMGVTVDKINLSGGVACFQGLVEIFSDAMEIECALWDPLKRIKLDKALEQDKISSIKSQLPVAIGLAIR